MVFWVILITLSQLITYGERAVWAVASNDKTDLS